MRTIATMLLLMIFTAVSAQETVVIGTQEWMKHNLNVGVMIPGTQDQTGNGTIEKYCYNNLESNCDLYGGLYQWNEAMQYATAEGSQGICPDGFHIPTSVEYQILYEYLGGENFVYPLPQSAVGAKLKETGFTHWNPLTPIIYTRPNYYDKQAISNNSTGLTLVGGGIRWHRGNFYYLKIDGNYWLSSEVSPTSAMWWGTTYSTSNANYGQFLKAEGLSIRCIKD